MRIPTSKGQSRKTALNEPGYIGLEATSGNQFTLADKGSRPYIFMMSRSMLACARALRVAGPLQPPARRQNAREWPMYPSSFGCDHPVAQIVPLAIPNLLAASACEGLAPTPVRRLCGNSGRMSVSLDFISIPPIVSSITIIGTVKIRMHLTRDDYACTRTPASISFLIGLDSPNGTSMISAIQKVTIAVITGSSCPLPVHWTHVLIDSDGATTPQLGAHPIQ